MVLPTAAVHLCSGYGGFELAFRHLGLDVRTVAHVERDSYAASVLVERMDEARLDQAPVWSDLATFDGRPWRGKVDLVTAGLPCQPFSAAGKQRGLDDERHLWPMARRVIREIGPRWVFLENVPQVVSKGWLAVVAEDLAEDGFDLQWGVLSAAAVGAPHKRERFWLVAHADSQGRSEVAGGSSGDEGADGRQQDSRHVADGPVEDVADATGGGLRTGLAGGSTAQKPAPAVHSSDVADAQGVGQREQNDGTCPQSRRDARLHPGRVGSGVGFPPGPDDDSGWRQWLTEGGSEPLLRRRADGPPVGLADALHLGGNGLVPQAAAAAFRLLADRFGS